MSTRNQRIIVESMSPEVKKVAQDSCAQIANLLQMYQKRCLVANERVSNMKKREVSPMEKHDLETQIAEIKAIDAKLKEMIATQTKQLNTYPPSSPTTTIPPDIIQFRTVLSKLTKDYDKMKVVSSDVYTDSKFIKLNQKDQEEYNLYLINNPIEIHLEKSNNANVFIVHSAATGSNNNNNNATSSSSTNNNDSNSNNASSSMGRVFGGSGGSNRNQQGGNQSNNNNNLQQLQRLQEKEFVITACEDVNTTIINERHEEITKIHQGTIMLNEMFIDLATLVDAQAPAVNEIAQNISATHEKTESGLNQIKTAERLQREGNKMCVIS